MIDERWLTVADIAAQMQVDEQTVRRWIRGGRLLARQLGGKAGYRVRPTDLQAFFESLPGADAEGEDMGKAAA